MVELSDGTVISNFVSELMLIAWPIGLKEELWNGTVIMWVVHHTYDVNWDLLSILSNVKSW